MKKRAEKLNLSKLTLSNLNNAGMRLQNGGDKFNHVRDGAENLRAAHSVWPCPNFTKGKHCGSF